MSVLHLTTPEYRQANDQLVTEIKEVLRNRLHELAPDALVTVTWDAFFTTYTDVMRALAARFRLEPRQTEELVHDVWTQVLYSLPKFPWTPEASGLRGWLYTVVRNRALQDIRSKARTRAHEVRPRDVEMLCAPQVPHDDWQGAWTLELLRYLLERLQQQVSPLNYRLFVMRCVERRPRAEVAALLGLEPNQITYRVKRMIPKLRSILAAYHGAVRREE